MIWKSACLRERLNIYCDSIFDVEMCFRDLMHVNMNIYIVKIMKWNIILYAALCFIDYRSQKYLNYAGSIQELINKTKLIQKQIQKYYTSFNNL